MNGKGDTYRPYNPEKFGNEFDRIFGKTTEENVTQETEIDPTEFTRMTTE